MGRFELPLFPSCCLFGPFRTQGRWHLLRMYNSNLYLIMRIRNLLMMLLMDHVIILISNMLMDMLMDNSILSWRVDRLVLLHYINPSKSILLVPHLHR